MFYAFTRHSVDDYDRWRAVYDDFADERRALGVVGDAVFRNVDNGNEVTLHLNFETLDAARKFVQNSEMRGAMDQAGLSGNPKIWLAEDA